MASKKQDKLIKHKQSALSDVEKFIDNLINSSDEKDCKKADKFCYWLENFTTFLEYESSFIPSKLKRYKRGDVIKVHLGYNVGSEEGGLHYAIVLDNANSINSPVITIVPLSSLKDEADIDKLHVSEVYIGNEIFDSLESKIMARIDKLYHDLDYIKGNAEEYIKEEAKHLNKMTGEISKMKKGSIALVSQITTISKIRIYDPKTKYDVLSGIKLSNDSLDKINNCIKKLYIFEK